MSFYLPLAHFAILQGRYDVAIRYLRRAMSMARKAGNGAACGVLLTALANCHAAKRS